MNLPNRKPPAGARKGSCEGVGFSSLVVDPDGGGMDFPGGGCRVPPPALSRPARRGEAVAVVAGGCRTLTSCPPPDGAG